VPNSYRIVTQIRDQDDFTGALTNGYFLTYSSGTGKFSLAAVSPGGSSGEFQYNNAGAFGGTSLVTYSAASSGTAVTIQAATSGVGLTVKAAATTPGNIANFANSSGTALASFSSSGYLRVGVSATSPIHVSGPASSSTLPFVKITGTSGTGLQYAIDASVTIGSGSNQTGAAAILGTMAGANNQNGSVFGVAGYVTGSANASGIGVVGNAGVNAGGKGLIGVLGAASAQNGNDSSTDLYGGVFEGGSNSNTGQMVVGVLGQARSGATSYYAGFFRLSTSGPSGYTNSRPTRPTSGAAALAADNGSSTADIFRLLDNGTTTFSVADGGTASILLGNAASIGCVVAGTTSQSAPLLQLQGTSSTTAGTAQAEVDTAWVDSTHATRKARLILRAYDTAARETARGWADGTYGRFAVSAPNAAPTDAQIGAAQVSFYLDEGGNNLIFRVCYTDGTTYKSGTVALV